MGYQSIQARRYPLLTKEDGVRRSNRGVLKVLGYIGEGTVETLGYTDKGGKTTREGGRDAQKEVHHYGETAHHMMEDGR